MNLRKEAKGRECQIRMAGVCNFNPDTTVLCHLPGGGMGMKQHDLFGAWGCSSCHDVVDGRTETLNSQYYSVCEITLWHYEGMKRTQEILLNEGKIKI